MQPPMKFHSYLFELFVLCLCDSLSLEEVYESFVCGLAIQQNYANPSRDSKGLKVFLEGESESVAITAMRQY